MSNDKTYQIQNTKGEWSDLRPDEVELYLNSNAVTRVKPVSVVSPSPTVAGQIKAGRPKGEATVTPGLRINRALWQQFKNAYPRQANKMFLNFVTESLQNKCK